LNFAIISAHSDSHVILNYYPPPPPTPPPYIHTHTEGTHGRRYTMTCFHSTRALGLETTSSSNPRTSYIIIFVIVVGTFSCCLKHPLHIRYNHLLSSVGLPFGGANRLWQRQRFDCPSRPHSMSPSHWLVSDILKLIGYTLRSNIEAVTDGVASRGAPDLLALNVSSPT
jgi:hypothetical protein